MSERQIPGMTAFSPIPQIADRLVLEAYDAELEPPLDTVATRRAVARMARRIEEVAGAMPAAPIVISDNFMAAKRRLFVGAERGGLLGEDLSAHETFAIRGTEQEKRKDVLGNFDMPAASDRPFVFLLPKVASQIANPRSPGHIYCVGVLAHEMGHLKEFSEGFRVPDEKIRKPSDQIARTALAEYLAVRTEVSVKKELFGKELGHKRLLAMSGALPGQLEKCHDLGGTLDAFDVNLPRQQLFLRYLGNLMGTSNGYLDAFKAAGAPNNLPVRTDQIFPPGSRANKALNGTRGGLSDAYRAMQSRQEPGTLLQRVMDEHERAVQSAIAKQLVTSLPVVEDPIKTNAKKDTSDTFVWR